MEISPPDGWQNFKQNEQLITLVENQLKLKESGGIWEFYNFSVNSMVWCSDEIQATNQLQITFDTNQTIRSFGVEMTNNSSEHFKQLFRLKKALKSKFSIRDTI